MTDWERALLVCTLEAIFNEDDYFTCHKCLSSFSNQPEGDDKEKLLTKMRKLKGCWGTIRQSYRVDKFEVSTCPGNYSTHQVHEFFSWYLKYEQFGILPYPGSLYDQPAKIMEIFDIIGSIKFKKLKERKDRQEMENKRNRLKGK